MNQLRGIVWSDKMKFALVITARMKSSRLPKKAMLTIKGKSLIEHLIDRMKIARLPDMIVLATSTHPDDEILAEVAEKNGILAFRGDQSDKLKRYLDASKKFDFDYMIDVSADNIFSDPICVDRIIEEFRRSDPDVIFCKDLPVGVSPLGLKMSAVEKICQMKDESDTEVYGPYFYHSNIFRVQHLEPEPILRRPDIRLTIDYEEDFVLACKIFEELQEDKNTFPLTRIIELFNKKPELLSINREAQHKYEENLKKITKPKVKPEYAKFFNFNRGVG
ncbi:MAG: hypothetical protein QXN01_04760 [Candidatus Anstonellales archaeon]